MAGTFRTTVTTSANTVSTITFPTYFDTIQVDNDDKTSDLWVRCDGVAPTVAGDDCIYVRAAETVMIGNPLPHYEPALGVAGSTVIKAISTAAIQFTAGAAT